MDEGAIADVTQSTSVDVAFSTETEGLPKSGNVEVFSVNLDLA